MNNLLALLIGAGIVLVGVSTGYLYGFSAAKRLYGVESVFYCANCYRKNAR